MNSSLSHLENKSTLRFRYYTKDYLNTLKNIPEYRLEDLFKGDPQIWDNYYSQIDANSQNFYRINISDKADICTNLILNDDYEIETNKFKIGQNYRVYILEIAGEIFTVCVSDKLEIDKNQTFFPSFPFLLHIHPIPQSNAEEYYKKRAELIINNQKIKSDRIDKGKPPYFGGLQQNKWDWFFYQSFLNIKKIIPQLDFEGEGVTKPFVIVIPFITIENELSRCMKIEYLESVLLTIQKAIITDFKGSDKFVLPDIAWINMSAFSISNKIMANFIRQNNHDDLNNKKNKSLFSKKMKDFISLDPTPTKPTLGVGIMQSAYLKSFSKIFVENFNSTNRNHKLILYCQDIHYIIDLLSEISLKDTRYKLTISVNSLKKRNISLSYEQKEIFNFIEGNTQISRDVNSPLSWLKIHYFPLNISWKKIIELNTQPPHNDFDIHQYFTKYFIKDAIFENQRLSFKIIYRSENDIKLLPIYL